MAAYVLALFKLLLLRPTPSLGKNGAIKGGGGVHVRNPSPLENHVFKGFYRNEP